MTQTISNVRLQRLIVLLTVVSIVIAVIALVVALNAGYSLDYETLARHCRAHLAAFKVPKQLILREQLPRNPSGKVLKRLLRDELR